MMTPTQTVAVYVNRNRALRDMKRGKLAVRVTNSKQTALRAGKLAASVSKIMNVPLIPIAPTTNIVPLINA